MPEEPIPQFDVPEGFVLTRFNKTSCLIPAFMLQASSEQFAGFRRVVERDVYNEQGGVSGPSVTSILPTTWCP